MIEDRQSGILVAPDDPEALALALRELISDPAERERMGNRGEAIFKARFRLEDTIERFEALYLSLSDAPAQAASNVSATSGE